MDEIVGKISIGLGIYTIGAAKLMNRIISRFKTNIDTNLTMYESCRLPFVSMDQIGKDKEDYAYVFFQSNGEASLLCKNLPIFKNKKSFDKNGNFNGNYAGDTITVTANTTSIPLKQCLEIIQTAIDVRIAFVKSYLMLNQSMDLDEHKTLFKEIALKKAFNKEELTPEEQKFIGHPLNAPLNAFEQAQFKPMFDSFWAQRNRGWLQPKNKGAITAFIKKTQQEED